MDRPLRFSGAARWIWITGVVAAAAACGPRNPTEKALGELARGVRADRINVLLVTLDTTRADRIGVYGRRFGAPHAETPALDSLAESGATFFHAASVTPLTLPSHCTLMTGLLPAAHGVRDNGGYRLAAERRTLAELFVSAGFRTGGFVSAYVLDRKWGIAQGFETYFDEFDLEKVKSLSMGEIQRPGNETVDRAIAWLDSLGPLDEQRFFAWVHLYDPHTPHEPAEPWKSRYPGQPYNAEVAWTDSLVGRLLDDLERRGVRDRTVVAVIGDHGESLGEHGEADHGYFIYRSTSWVPFLLAGPYAGLAGKRIDLPVGQADLAPTLLELAGAESRQGDGLEPGQGRSLVSVLAGGADPPGALPRAYSESFLPRLHYGWAELRSLRSERWHFIEAPRAELYDVESDPAETVNLADRERRTVRELRAALEALDATVKPAAEGETPVEEDEETMRALAALGYVGGQAIDTSRSFRDLADPKDRLDVYAKMGKARSLARGAGSGEAKRLLEEVLTEDPEVVDAWFTLANIQYRERDWERAAQNFRETLSRRPDHDWAMIGLADTYVARGEIDAAVLGYRQHLERDADNAQIHYRLAQVLLDAGRDDEADAAFRRTLEVEPATARAEVGRAVIEFRRRRFADSHQALDRALAIDPKAKFARYNRALLYEAESRFAEAAAAYRAEIADYPDGFKAWFNLGRLLERLGDRPGSVEALSAAVASDGNYAPGRFFLGRALLATGDLDAAEREAKKGLELDSESGLAPLGHYVLADVYSRRGRFADAERQARLGRAAEARSGRIAADGEEPGGS